MTAMMITAARAPFATVLPFEYEHLKQASHIAGNTGKNVDHQDDGNTIADALLCDPLTNPHQECRYRQSELPQPVISTRFR